jgi:ribose transport system substrate-binding protein
MFKKKTVFGLTAAAAVIALALAGCSGTAAATDSTAAAGNSADLAAFTATAQALVDLKSGIQTQTPPTDSPKAVSGMKKIMVIPCAMGAEGCARPANAAVQAAEAIGWEATINDPGGDPTKMADAVAQAISSGYDAIVLTAIDAQTIQGSLQQAKDAGLLIADFAAKDTETGTKLLDVNVPAEQDFYDQGYAMGAKIFLDKGPDVKIAMLTGTEFGSIRLRSEGTKQFVADCVAAGGGCEIVAEQNFLVTDLATTLPTQTAAMVRANPTATALWFGYDAGGNFGMQGLDDAGLGDQVSVYGFDANVANLTRIAEEKTQVASAGSAMEWIGFGMIDNFKRIWSGQDAVDQGVTFKLLTKDNVVSGSAWDGDISVADLYTKMWR